MANSTETVIDFSSHITERTRDFTGREWVFQAINDWLAHSEGPRFFLLTGEPGSGKSAIAARLVQFSEGAVSPTDGLPRLSKCFLSGVHFCWAADRRWIDPHVFAESVALQLAARHPAYAEALAEKSGDLQIHIEVSLRVQDMAGGQMAGVVINKLDVSGVSPEDAFIRVVREPLEALLREEPDLRIVLLADALDEALVHSGKVSIVDLIAQADYLPPGVRWIVTSRPVTEVVRPLRRSRLGLEERSLTEGAGLARSLDDVNRHVLSNFIERQELAGRLAADLSPAAFAATVRDKSEGNFLYVRYLLEMLVIRQGKIDQESLDELPVGLEGIYLAFLERLVQGDREAWRERYAPVLGTLAVAQQPLTEEQLASFVGTNRGRVRDVLTSLRQLLDANESLPASQRTHTLYHRTFAEFLLDEDRAEEYWCEKQEQHQRIIDHYRGKAPHWEAVDWHQVDDYGLMHLAGHLYALSDQAPFRSEFYQLICKPFMQEKLIRTSSHSAFAKDVALAIAVATPDASPPGIVELIRGCLIYATLGSLATHVPPEVLGTLALVGQTSRACSYAALILDTNRQSAAFRLIGEALLIHGDVGDVEDGKRVLRQALAAAETIANAESNAHALGQLAQALAYAGDQASALAVANQALAAAETIADVYERASALGWVAQALVQARDQASALAVANRALAAAETIANAKVRASALVEVAQALVQAGDQASALAVANRALAAAETITEAGEPAPVLVEVARALGWIAKPERALQLLRAAFTTAQRGGRDTIFEVLTYGTPMLAAVDHGDTLWSVYEAVQDVDSWWDVQ